MASHFVFVAVSSLGVLLMARTMRSQPCHESCLRYAARGACIGGAPFLIFTPILLSVLLWTKLAESPILVPLTMLATIVVPVVLFNAMVGGFAGAVWWLLRKSSSVNP
jgi:hypothetical protein